MEILVYILLIVVAPILLLSIIDNYFSLKAYETLEKTNLYKDKEVMDEIGVADAGEALDDIHSAEDRKRNVLFILVLVSLIILLPVVVISLVLGVVELKSFMIGSAIVGLLALLTIIDKWLTYKEIEKFEIEDYRIKIEKERKRLVPIRIFFFISSVIVIIVVLTVQQVYDLKKLNESYYEISNSILFMYIGGMGLVAKMMFLKVPFRLDGKLQPYINSIFLIGGIVLLLRSLYTIFM